MSAVILVATALAAWVVVSRLIGTWPLDVHLRDDAYYYFAWARSLAGGDGPCVTPGVSTSGVHLLWPLMLTVVVWGVGTAVLPDASVWLGLGMHLVTALLIYRVALPARGFGWLAACAFAGSPYLAGEVMHGQTAVTCLALIVFLSIHGRSPRAFLIAGLIAVAARSDLIFFVAAAALVEPKQRARRLVLTSIILGCYALANFLIAGHWLQDSARPIPWLFAAEFEHGGGNPWERLWTNLQPILTGIRFRLTSTPLAVCWLLVAWIGWRRREPRFAWWLLGGLGLVCLHDLWRCYPRDYYFAPLAVVGALALVRLRVARPRLAFVLALAALVWNGKHLPDPMRTHPAQREMAMAGRLVQEFLPLGEPLGCFNAGLVAWHHPGVVINLDGVVNRPAFDALQRGALLAYLESQGVHYLIDNPVQFERRGVHANGRHFGGGFDAQRDLEECVRFHWPAAAGDRGRLGGGIEWFSLYRLRGGGKTWRESPGLRDLGPVPGGRAIAWAARKGQRLRASDADGSCEFEAPEDLTYVLQVMWGGEHTLLLTVVGDDGLRLVIAPD